MNVKVTNLNDQLLRDKHGGIQYSFPPREPVTIPKEAAEHIFGYGLSEEERFRKFMRMGLANHPRGLEIWDKVKIRPAGNVQPTGAVREASAP